MPPRTDDATFVVLFLTCANKAEAERISLALLERKLIACSKMGAVHSLFTWEGIIQGVDEVLLIMETRNDLCTNIEETVRQFHSYKSFVMVGTPVTYVSSQAHKWLQESLAVL